MTATPTTPTGPASSGPRYPQVRYTLPDITSPDANAFALIGAVARRLRTQVDGDAAGRFTARAAACRSYRQLLELIEATVTVTNP